MKVLIGCEYFVLDLTHDKHAGAALLAYAHSCAAEYPLLASDLLCMVDGSREPNSDEAPPNAALTGAEGRSPKASG